MRRRAVGVGARGIHLHHRRRSIHVSPASETRTSKRLRPGPSWRSGVIQTMRASTKRTTRARGVFLRHPADGLLGDPEPDLAAVGVELGPEPEGSVRFQGGVPRRQGPRPAGPVLAPPLDDDRQLAAGQALIFHDNGVIYRDYFKGPKRAGRYILVSRWRAAAVSGIPQAPYPPAR